MQRRFNKKFLNHKLLYIVYFFIISSVTLIPLIAPFFRPGRAWTYDTDIHQTRMAAFHKALLDGQFPPRWTSTLNFGWGSPVFTFNWSLPYWMAEPFLFAGWTTTDASKAVVILSVILSYVTMFVFLFTWLGFWPAIAGSVIYEWSLFRLYLLFTGGGLGMETAFIFWPVLFWAVLIGKKHQDLAFVFSSLAVAGTMLSHQVMFLMVLPMWFFYIFYLSHKDKKSGMIGFYAASYLTGLGLTAYFWLPAFFEQNFIHISITQNLVANNFLDLATIFHQPGITDRVPPLQYWYWSTGWILFAVAIVSMIFLRKDKKLRIFNIFIVFFWVGQFLLTRISDLVWKTMPLLLSFQYPVRFQALSLFCASVLAAYIVYRVRIRVWLACFFMIIVTIGINIKAIPTNWPGELIADSEYYSGNLAADAMGEYLPRWADINHFFTIPDKYTRYPVGRIIDGQGEVTDLVKRASSLSFTVRAKGDSAVVVNQLYFPGWVVTLNGNRAEPVPYGFGEMLVRVPKGVWHITARFTDTSIRTAGNWIALGTAAALALFYLGRFVLKQR